MKSLKLAYLTMGGVAAILSSSSFSYSIVVGAAADRFCSTDTSLVSPVIPSNGGDVVNADGCTLTAQLVYEPTTLITSGGSGPTFRYTNGVISSGYTMDFKSYVGQTDDAYLGALPVTIEVSGNTVEMNTPVAFTGFYPPASRIAFSGNTFGAYTGSVTANSIVTFTNFVAGAGTEITVSGNTHVKSYTHTPYVFGTVSLGESAQLTVSENSIAVAETSAQLSTVSAFALSGLSLNKAGVFFRSNTVTIRQVSDVDVSSQYVRSIAVTDVTRCVDCLLVVENNDFNDGPVDGSSEGDAGMHAAVYMDATSTALEGIAVVVSHNRIKADMYPVVSDDYYGTGVVVKLKGGKQTVLMTNNTVQSTQSTESTDRVMGLLAHFASPGVITATIANNTIISPIAETSITIGAPSIAAGSSIFIEGNQYAVGEGFYNSKGLVTFIDSMVMAASSVLSVQNNHVTSGSAGKNVFAAWSDDVAGAVNPLTANAGSAYLCGNKDVGGTDFTDEYLSYTYGGEGMPLSYFTTDCSGAPVQTLTLHPLMEPSTAAEPTTTASDAPAETTTTAAAEGAATTTTAAALSAGSTSSSSDATAEGATTAATSPSGATTTAADPAATTTTATAAGSNPSAASTSAVDGTATAATTTADGVISTIPPLTTRVIASSGALPHLSVDGLRCALFTSVFAIVGVVLLS